MNKFKNLYQRFEKTVSSAKFAVVIILAFAISLCYGTFMESYHGTEYANRLVYKSWWFMGIEVCMFLSIFMAVVVRLPLKKRLYGFYTIHSGLMMMFAGSLFTYLNGIDGSIQIIPNTPSKKILVNEDYLKITFPLQKKAFKLALPYTYGPAEINKEVQGIKVESYFPFAENKLTWQASPQMNPQIHSTQYQLFNDNMSQDFVLSLAPTSDFKSTMTLGLLSIHYMPEILKDCFVTPSKSELIIWNLATSECFAPEERKIKLQKTKTNNRFLVIPHQGQSLKFFPDFAPVAVNDDFSKNPNTPFRVLSRTLFQDKPNLFLFGNFAAYYLKRKKNWKLVDITSDMAKLPWMGFKIRKLKHSNDKIPVEIPSYVTPIQENGKVVLGDKKAVLISYQGRDFWVRNDGPLEITNGSDRVQFQIAPKEIALPYEITLERFQMNKDPGTNNPASYESFVQLLDGRNTKGIQKAHVYMNNPLKYDDFTFYQSSYFPIGPNEQYGSVLTVNYDPGRFFKYLASILVVFGSIWHFVLRRNKTKK